MSYPTFTGTNRPRTFLKADQYVCVRCGIHGTYKASVKSKPEMCVDCTEVEAILSRGGYTDCGRTAISGDRAHLKLGETPCDACRDRHNIYKRERAAA